MLRSGEIKNGQELRAVILIKSEASSNRRR
jgi:hypothetical protein